MYPILIPIFFRGVPRWYRLTALTVLFLFVTAAHIFLETPSDQFHTWADGVSRFSRTYGQPNLLHIQSPVMGTVAVCISILLSVMLAFALVATIRERRG